MPTVTSAVGSKPDIVARKEINALDPFRHGNNSSKRLEWFPGIEFTATLPRSDPRGYGMRRREFIALVGGAVAVPLVARAQQPAKVKRIAIVEASLPVANIVASYHRSYRGFFDELSRQGFVEGKNLVVSRYSAEGHIERYSQLAREVVDTQPDAILSIETVLGLAFKAATSTIPIVTISSDPVAMGLVSNIARPGGNVTGTAVNAGLEIWGKRIGLLKEALPKLTNVSVIAQTRAGWEGPFGSAVRQAAKAANIPLKAVAFDGKIDEAEYQRVFIAFDQDRPDALIVSDYPVHLANCPTIVELAARHRIPTMYAWRDFVERGGLMSYATDLEELGRSNAYRIGQILNGTNPGDIPFNQVTRYELALNTKTAKSLGIEFPSTLLSSADFVIE
jgi:putative tryptophan/tyrosine transport system substrate-binding protein